MLKLDPLTEHTGVEARGIDVNALSSDEFSQIYDAWIKAAVLVIRDQHLTPIQQLSFTDRFGERVSYTRSQFAANAAIEVLVLSNIRKDGKLIGSPVSGRVWHTDGHYLERPPAGSMLHAIEVPPIGGDTYFSNTAAAYADLPDCVKERLDGLQVIISRVQSRPYNYPERPPPSAAEREEWVDMPQEIILTHPINGRKALYAGGSVPWRIVGMDEGESAPLVTFLQEFSSMPRYVYRHSWRPGDIVVWDNRSSLHRATYYDGEKYRRLLYRTTFGAPR